jgi:hypothetical protein
MRPTVAASSFVATVLSIFALCGCHHGPKEVPIAATRSPDLEPRADQFAHSSVPDGERITPSLFGVAHHDDESTSYQLQLEAGQCYWFGWAGDSTIKEFAVYLFDPSDKRLDSARGKPREGVFSHCAKQNGIHRFEAKVQEGGGHYALVIYRKKGAAPPPPEPKLDLAATIEKQAASAAPGATRVGEFFSGSTEISDWTTQIEPGKCYWIIGAGEPGKVKRLYLYLWDAQNKRVTESKGTSEQAMLGYCAKGSEAGMFKFEAKVDAGKGNYKVGIYAK